MASVSIILHITGTNVAAAESWGNAGSTDQWWEALRAGNIRNQANGLTLDTGSPSTEPAPTGLRYTSSTRPPLNPLVEISSRSENDNRCGDHSAAGKGRRNLADTIWVRRYRSGILFAATRRLPALQVAHNRHGVFDEWRVTETVSNYIGETEKNMVRVFDGVQNRGSVLLFDEADALFGRPADGARNG